MVYVPLIIYAFQCMVHADSPSNLDRLSPMLFIMGTSLASSFGHLISATVTLCAHAPFDHTLEVWTPCATVVSFALQVRFWFFPDRPLCHVTQTISSGRLGSARLGRGVNGRAICSRSAGLVGLV